MRRLGLVSITLALAAALFSAACTDNKGSEGVTPAPTAPPATTAPPVAPPPPPPATASAAPAPKVEIELSSVANTMAFDKTKLTVPTGATVHLVLKNHSTMSTLPHNWVLVAPGTEAKVAAQGLAEAPDAGYVIPGANVLAYTPLAAPGATTEVTFTAPAAGTYPFICTVPGHYMMMKGTLTVTP
jgi:azurin